MSWDRLMMIAEDDYISLQDSISFAEAKYVFFPKLYNLMSRPSPFENEV